MDSSHFTLVHEALAEHTLSTKNKRRIFLAYLKKVFKHLSRVREPLFSLQSDTELLKTVTKSKFGWKMFATKLQP